MVINGGLEGNCDRTDGRVDDRINQYERILAYNGGKILENEKLDTKGMNGSNWVMEADGTQTDDPNPGTNTGSGGTGNADSPTSYVAIWDATKQYASEENEKKYLYTGNNHVYKFTGWWSTIGKSPDKDTANWKDLGEYQDPAISTTTTTNSGTTTTLPETGVTFDVNGDNKFDGADVVFIKKLFLVGTTTFPKSADANADGTYNGADIIYMKKELLKR
jgi:hypothetical protein